MLQKSSASLRILLLKLMSLPGTYSIRESLIISPRCEPTLREYALVMILRSHEEMEIGRQFFISRLSLPALGIRDMTLVDCD